MVVHVSMAKYKDQAGGRTKEENLRRAKALTEELGRTVPTISRIEVGVNVLNGRPTDYDVVSYSEYADMAAIQATVKHPKHDELIAFLNEVAEVSHAVTYEVSR
jgi:stress responsive alpha/beta barrel protein